MELVTLADLQRVVFASACAEVLLKSFGSDSTASVAMGAAECEQMERVIAGAYHAVMAHIGDLVAARTFRGDDRSVEISQVRKFVGRGLGG